MSRLGQKGRGGVQVQSRLDGAGITGRGTSSKGSVGPKLLRRLVEALAEQPRETLKIGDAVGKGDVAHGPAGKLRIGQIGGDPSPGDIARDRAVISLKDLVRPPNGQADVARHGLAVEIGVGQRPGDEGSRASQSEAVG